jgi:ribosomal biogenesis protein LAS1
MPLPHALESLLSILVAVRQDNASSDVGLSSSLSLRQSYAAALIRLVNGLVDPLQSGTYARSILSIAAQIGLPAWLVELRHAATHEDLPSLELLRDGAKEVSRLGLYHRALEKKKNRKKEPFLIHFSLPSLSLGYCTTTFSPR